MKIIIKDTGHQQFLLILIVLNLFVENRVSASACDKTRKIFSGLPNGEITHLNKNSQNSNYTQVTFFIF